VDAVATVAALVGTGVAAWTTIGWGDWASTSAIDKAVEIKNGKQNLIIEVISVLMVVPYALVVAADGCHQVGL
jgi:hypothetical protein